jgi:hypothetical protein
MCFHQYTSNRLRWYRFISPFFISERLPYKGRVADYGLTRPLTTRPSGSLHALTAVTRLILRIRDSSGDRSQTDKFTHNSANLASFVLAGRPPSGAASRSEPVCPRLQQSTT